MAAGFTDEYTDRMNRRFEEWVNGKISDEAFWTEADAIQAGGSKSLRRQYGAGHRGLEYRLLR